MELTIGLTFKAKNTENMMYYTIEGILGSIVDAKITLTDDTVEVFGPLTKMFSSEALKKGFENGHFYPYKTC